MCQPPELTFAALRLTAAANTYIVFNVPSAVLRIFCTSAQVIIIIIIWGQSYCYSYFADEETEGPERLNKKSQLHSESTAEAGFTPRHQGPRAGPLHCSWLSEIKHQCRSKNRTQVAVSESEVGRGISTHSESTFSCLPLRRWPCVGCKPIAKPGGPQFQKLCFFVLQSSLPYTPFYSTGTRHLYPEH